jgi:hypothetical protein
MVPTNPKTRRNKSSTSGRHTIGGAPPPEVISAQAQDDLGEWFPLGLTRALVVRKRRGLRRQILRAYQDRSINALVYRPQRAASSRLKVYPNIKIQGATPRIEGSIKLLERKQQPQANEIDPRSLDSLISLLQAKKPSNSCRIFSCILGSWPR